MKLTLHKLKEGFVITSDEKIQRYDDYLSPTYGVLKSMVDDWEGELIKLGCRKVIAQQHQIDFSALTEEEQKKIGWFDVEKLWEIFNTPYNRNIPLGREQFVRVINFQKAQELLSDRMFTINDMKCASSSGVDAATLNTDRDGITDYEAIEQESKEYFDELKEPKSWEVGVEMEWFTEDDEEHDEGGTLPSSIISESKPKFANGKIKITKIL